MTGCSVKSPDNTNAVTMRQGPVAASFRPDTHGTGTARVPANMQPLPNLQDQVDTALRMLAPCSQYLSLREYLNAASPTDFRKCISATGGGSKWLDHCGCPRVAAAQELGALAVRKTTADCRMVTTCRKLIKNEISARLVLGAEPPAGGAEAGPDVVDAAGDRLSMVVAQNYNHGDGKPAIAPLLLEVTFVA